MQTDNQVSNFIDLFFLVIDKKKTFLQVIQTILVAFKLQT